MRHLDVVAVQHIAHAAYDDALKAPDDTARLRLQLDHCPLDRTLLTAYIEYTPQLGCRPTTHTERERERQRDRERDRDGDRETERQRQRQRQRDREGRGRRVQVLGLVEILGLRGYGLCCR